MIGSSTARSGELVARGMTHNSMALWNQGGTAHPQWPSGRMAYAGPRVMGSTSQVNVPSAGLIEKHAPRAALFLTSLFGKGVIMAATWMLLAKSKLPARQQAATAIGMGLGVSWLADRYVDRQAGLAGARRPLGGDDTEVIQPVQADTGTDWQAWVSTAAEAWAASQDAHEQVYILRERLATLQAMGIPADNWLYRRTAAKLAAAERSAGLEEETESAARSWNVLAQVGLTTGIGVGLAIIVVLGLVGRKLL